MTSALSEGEPPTPPPERPALAILACSGIVLVLVCLYWNRIALVGRLGIAPPWVHDLARPIAVAYEALIGPIQTDPPGRPQTHRIAQLAGSWIIATMVYFTGVWLVLRRGERIGGVALDVIIAISIVCRLVLIFSPPLLETDPCRYVWDGATLARGINPYKYAPMEVLRFRERESRPRTSAPVADARVRVELALLSEAADDERLTWNFFYINHPEFPTVYPPVAQHLFSLAYRIAPGDAMVLKAITVALDLGILWLVASLLSRLGQPPAYLLIYGWCPLALKEYAQTGHYDPAATFCLLAFLLLLLRGSRLLSGAYLGLAALSKLFPLVLIPVTLRRLGVAGTLAAIVTLALLWLPFLDIGLRAFTGLFVYARGWVMNASIFALIDALVGNSTWTKAILGVAYLLLLLDLARKSPDRAQDLVERAFLAIGALVLISPVCDPWYVAWVLPLAAVLGRVWPVVLAGTSMAYYVYQGHGTYQLGGLDLRWIEYLPCYVILLVEETRAWRSQRPDVARS